MKKPHRFLPIAVSIAILSALTLSPTRANESKSFKVIVNSSNPINTIKKTTLAQLFLKKKSSWSHGAKALPVDQKMSSPVRKVFSKVVLKKAISAVNAYWQQRIFSGRDVPPSQQISDAAIVAFVTSNKGAVGYVSATTDTGSTKVLKIVD